MKLFYFADFVHVKKYGSPITYDTYVNLEHGPIPSTIKNLVDTAYDDIDNSVLADTIRFERPDGYMHRVVPLRKFNEKDERHFSESELQVLRGICDRFANKNAKYIEQISHNESPWKSTQFLEEIPYTLASRDNDSRVEADEIELLMKI